jgi:1-acyl-sn-glycerol-3-phosphate acyltransferase
MAGTARTFPEPHPGLQVKHSLFTRLIGRLYLRIGGWRIEGKFPEQGKFVTVVAPHSSNWDFALGLAVKFALRLKVTWLGKHTLFKAPFGGLLRRLGGISVDRGSPHGVVGDCIQALGNSAVMMLALAPEGTRKAGRTWRSGFYQIALGAGLPIFPVGFDYRRRVVQLFPVFQPSGDYEADLPRIRAIFQDVKPKYD